MDIDLRFPSPIEKAARYLIMVNDKAVFSLERLSRHLSEVGLVYLVGIAIHGPYRNYAYSPGALPTTATAEN